MSKSLGNFYTLRDIFARGISPEAVRYLLASVPYRKALNFTFDGLVRRRQPLSACGISSSVWTPRSFPKVPNAKIAEQAAAALAGFRAAMDDDLNTAEALAFVFEFLRDANTALDAGSFRRVISPARMHFSTSSMPFLRC